MQTSKYGSSVLMTSPSMTSSLFCSGLPCTLFVTSAAIRGSSSTANTRLAFSRILTVRFPEPGPTSRTVWWWVSASVDILFDDKEGTNVALLQVCFVDYGLSYAWVYQHMLANVSVHLEYCVGPLSLGRCISVRMALRSIISLLACHLRHLGHLGGFCKSWGRAVLYAMCH